MKKRRGIEILLVLVLVGIIAKWQVRRPEPANPEPTNSPVFTASPKMEQETDGWNPLSDKVRKGIEASQASAEEENEQLIDCRLLMMGLRQGNHQIDAYLRARDVSLGENVQSLPHGSSRITDNVHQAVQFARDKSKSRGENGIELIDVFQGILRTDSKATQAMKERGVNLTDFQQWLAQQPKTPTNTQSPKRIEKNAKFKRQ